MVKFSVLGSLDQQAGCSALKSVKTVIAKSTRAKWGFGLSGFDLLSSPAKCVVF